MNTFNIERDLGRTPTKLGISTRSFKWQHIISWCEHLAMYTFKYTVIIFFIFLSPAQNCIFIVYFIQGSHQKSELFPWQGHKFPKPFSAFSETFYLEHEMIITPYSRWKSQHFLYCNNQHFKKHSLTFPDVLEKQKSSLTFHDRLIFQFFSD